MTKLDDWLKELGLKEYSSVLAKNDIDFDVLLATVARHCR